MSDCRLCDARDLLKRSIALASEPKISRAALKAALEDCLNTIEPHPCFGWEAMSGLVEILVEDEGGL